MFKYLLSLLFAFPFKTVAGVALLLVWITSIVIKYLFWKTDTFTTQLFNPNLYISLYDVLFFLIALKNTKNPVMNY